MRKVYVEVKVKLIINTEEGVEIDKLLEDMNYSFNSSDLSKAIIEDTEIIDWEITDSK